MKRSTKTAIVIIAVFALARLAFAATLGLGVDESYSLVMARTLRLSYFDHPPLHLWLAHFSALIFGESLAARLPFVALFCVSGWLLFRLTRRLFGADAAIVAIAALNATPFFFASAGSWIVPDGPLVFALLGAVDALARASEDRDEFARKRIGKWFAVGVWFGLAGLSKYSAALSAAGAVAFLATAKSRQSPFMHVGPYLAAAVGLLTVSPVLIWNAAHNWASFAFQGDRGLWSGRLRPAQVAAMVLGQAVYLAPWIAGALVVAMIQAWKRWPQIEARLCLLLAAPPIAFFTLTPLWGARGLPHWTMPGWLFVYPLLGAWAVAKGAPSSRWNVIGGAVTAATLIIAVILVIQARTGRFTQELGLGSLQADVTRETMPWDALREALDGGRGPAFVASVKWADAGKIGLAMGGDVPILVYSDDARGFAFERENWPPMGSDGWIVVRLEQEAQTRAALKSDFDRLGPSMPLSIERGGRPEIALVSIPAIGLRRLP